METWHQILLVVMALMMVFFLVPAASRSFKHGPKGSRDDWLGFIKPILVVIAFVVMLIVIARG